MKQIRYLSKYSSNLYLKFSFKVHLENDVKISLVLYSKGKICGYIFVLNCVLLYYFRHSNSTIKQHNYCIFT